MAQANGRNVTMFERCFRPGLGQDAVGRLAIAISILMMAAIVGFCVTHPNLMQWTKVSVEFQAITVAVSELYHGAPRGVGYWEINNLNANGRPGEVDQAFLEMSVGRPGANECALKGPLRES